MAFFQQVVAERNLGGVILAHHADDQAETALQRLLRGSGFEGLCGMAPVWQLGALRVLRPLLNIGRVDLRAHLASIGQAWREDPTNASDKYLRNRLRVFLATRPQLSADLLAVSKACLALRDWAEANVPHFGENVPIDELVSLPPLLARHAARAWLIARGAPAQSLTPQSLDQLLAMAADAACPSRADFPGNLRIRRRRGLLFVDAEDCNPPARQTRS